MAGARRTADVARGKKVLDNLEDNIMCAIRLQESQEEEWSTEND